MVRAPLTTTHAMNNQDVSRRGAMASMFGAGVAVAGGGVPQPAWAAYGNADPTGVAATGGVATYSQFYGAADPPATYGGVGGTTLELARYGYFMNDKWREEPVGKVDKAIAGIDSQWSGPAKRKAFCVTLNRAGEDGKEFTIGNPVDAIRSVAGAQPDLQDALQLGTLTYEEKKDPKGNRILLFEVSETKNHYRVSIQFEAGRLFSFFVTSPEASWQADKANLDKIFESFEVYDNGKFVVEE